MILISQAAYRSRTQMFSSQEGSQEGDFISSSFFWSHNSTACYSAYCAKPETYFITANVMVFLEQSSAYKALHIDSIHSYYACVSHAELMMYPSWAVCISVDIILIRILGFHTSKWHHPYINLLPSAQINLGHCSLMWLKILLLCYTSETIVLCGFYPEDVADFSFKDGNRLCSLFLRQQGLIKKKRRSVQCLLSSSICMPPPPLNCTLHIFFSSIYAWRWLTSLNPELGVPFKLKRPKFLKVV